MAIFNAPITRVGDDNFKVGAGYKLYFYEAGTTTLKDTYTSNTYATPLANPVVADGDGRFSVIWTSGNYKVKLTDASDVEVWTVDNYDNDSAASTYAAGVLSAAGSAANVITADLPTAPGTLVDQQQVVVELQHGVNTIGNPTFNLNSLGAKVIQRDDTKPLRGGDTGGSGYKLYLSYSATNDVWVLLNPAMPVVGLGLRWKSGLEVTNSSGTPDEIIDIAVGQILDDTESAILDLKSAFTKSIASTFAVGTGNGGFSDASESGTGVQASSWYGLFMIGKVDGTVDFIYAETQAHALADTVAAAANFVYARLVGYVLTDGSANIIPFIEGENGSTNYKTRIVDHNATVSSSGQLITVSCPPFQTYLAAIGCYNGDNANHLYAFQETAATDAVVTASNCDIYIVSDGGSNVHMNTIKSIKADSSSQIRARSATSGVFTTQNTTIQGLGYKMDYSITDLV